MKRTLVVVIAALSSLIIFAQPPEKISYQAVIRNSNNQLVANTVIRIRISILQGSTAGNELYVETHSHTTNANGLVTIEIGGGTIISGNLSNINWANGPYYIKTEIDPTGGTNYTITGTSQLLSVPYALYAETANSVENLNVEDADADPENELQTLELTGKNLSISGGNSVILPDELTDNDTDSTNELQVLSISNDTIYLTSGGFIVLPKELLLRYLSIINSSNVEKVGLFTLDEAGQILLKGSNNSTNISLSSNILNSNTGHLTVNNSSGLPKTAMYINSDVGILETLGPNGTTNIALSFAETDLNAGYVSVHDEFGINKSCLYVNDEGQGAFGARGQNGNENVVATNLLGFPNDGYLTVNNSLGISCAELHSDPASGGILKTFGANGNSNFIVSNLLGYPNYGFISVQDAAGISQAGMYVDALGLGRVEADLKNFKIDHPNQPSKEIVYASIEGPEAAAYERGTGSLINGETFIEYSEHFRIVTSGLDVTVMLTPLSADSKGLAVVEKKSNGFKIKELLNGAGNYEFDWEVKAKRKGFENYEVIRDKVNLENNSNSLPAK